MPEFVLCPPISDYSSIEYERCWLTEGGDMCGIAGWVSYDSDLTTKREVVEAMTATMSRRGPDSTGTWIRRQVALGHRRLAIIDLPGGIQPMTVQTANGSITLVYTGEVYNFVELRKDLTARGHRFRTESDTEVVLHGYLEWGDRVAERLNGMYAFAIWDERNATLVMIRDRMGIKPLYYYSTGDGVLFGSEPKSILANPLVPKTIDADGLRGLVAFTMTPGWSVWKGIREVEPGTIVTVDTAGMRTTTYWKLSAAPHVDDQEATVAKIRELMTDIVRRQMRADVPRCVLLSGGLDSSAITGLAAAQLAEQGERLRTFSVDFPYYEKEFRPDAQRDTPDGPFIREVADLVGSVHSDVVLDPAALSDPAVRRAVVTARDTPAGWGEIDASLYLLCKAIREESTVALSGEAADEVFGGYPWFNQAGVRPHTFPWLVPLEGSANPLTGVFHAETRKQLDVDGYAADQYATAVAGVEFAAGANESERFVQRTCYLALTRFMRMLLDRKDRISMAVGLEVRVPYCDHRLIEYVYNAPWSMKTFDNREKSLLRHATADVLPPSVVQRRKCPYPSTQDVRYTGALQLQAKGILAEKDTPLFTLVNRDWLLESAHTDLSAMTRGIRMGLSLVLDLYHWFDIYQPDLLLD